MTGERETEKWGGRKKETEMPREEAGSKTIAQYFVEMTIITKLDYCHYIFNSKLITYCPISQKQDSVSFTISKQTQWFSLLIFSLISRILDFDVTIVIHSLGQGLPNT